MFDFKKITGNVVNQAKRLLVETPDRVNIIDGIFALGHLAQSSSQIIGALNDHVSSKLAQPEEDSGQEQTQFRDMFLDFLSENKHRFDALEKAGPLVLDWAFDQLFKVEDPFDGLNPLDLPLDDVKAWFENILELAIDRSLGFMDNEDLDPVDMLRTFEVLVEVFIQDWLIPQIDKELGI